MPSLDVYLHRSHEACSEGIGLYHAGRIDLCTKTSSEPYQRKFALHEMAHAWTEAQIKGAILNRFMEIRGIAHWNDRSEDWKDRGTEQAAEISPGASARARSCRCFPRPLTFGPSPASMSC